MSQKEDQKTAVGTFKNICTVAFCRVLSTNFSKKKYFRGNFREN